MSRDRSPPDPASPVCFADEGAAEYLGYLEPGAARAALLDLAARARAAEGVADRLRRRTDRPALAQVSEEAEALVRELADQVSAALPEETPPLPSPANAADADILASMLAELHRDTFRLLLQVPDPDLHRRLDGLRRAGQRVEDLHARLVRLSDAPM